MAEFDHKTAVPEANAVEWLCDRMEILPTPFGEEKRFVFTPEINAEILSILRRYPVGQKPGEYLDVLARSIQSTGKLPWLLVFFGNELPVSGHLARVRQIATRLWLFPYSALRVKIETTKDVPMVGALTLPSKAILERLAPESPVLEVIWDLVRDNDASSPWVMIYKNPPAKWLVADRMADAQEYMAARKREGAMRRVPGFKPILAEEAFWDTLVASVGNAGFEMLRLAEKLVRENPTQPYAQVLLGDAHGLLGDRDHARKCYHEALRLGNRHAAPLIEKLERQAHSISDPLSVRREVLLTKAEQVSHDHRLGCERAWIRIMTWHAEDGAPDLEARACNAAIQCFPYSLALWDEKARMHEQHGELEEALAAMFTCMQLGRDAGRQWFEMARIYQNMGQSSHAAQAYRLSVEENPDMPQAWANLGQTHAWRGEFDGGARCCRQAIDLDRHDIGAYRSVLCECFVALGKPTEAIEVGRQAWEMEPCRSARLSLSRAYILGGKYAAAARHLLGLITDDWDDAKAWFTLGHCYARWGRSGKAKEVLRQLQGMDLAWTAQLREELSDGSRRKTTMQPVSEP